MILFPNLVRLLCANYIYDFFYFVVYVCYLSFFVRRIWKRTLNLRGTNKLLIIIVIISLSSLMLWSFEHTTTGWLNHQKLSTSGHNYYPFREMDKSIILLKHYTRSVMNNGFATHQLKGVIQGDLLSSYVSKPLL